MPQAIRAPGDRLPTVARRSPWNGYRVEQAQVSTGFGPGKRVLGLWVPGEAFRRGTIIRCTGTADGARGLVMVLSIGGDAKTAQAGVAFSFTETSLNSGTVPFFMLTATQRFDGLIPTFDSSGFHAGVNATVVSTGTFSPFIQPLNYVELTSPSVAVDLVGCVLEVIPPQYNHRSYQEIFAT